LLTRALQSPSSRAIRLVIQLAHRLPLAVSACVNQLLSKAGGIIATCVDGSGDGGAANLLLCDAILGCVHETCHDIKDHVPLAQVAVSLVLPCMSQPSCHRVLMRRCCLFLGETSTLLAGIDRSLFFRAIFHALSQDDAAVALAACSAICQSMDGLDLSSGQGDL
jgi:hypothetical protein